MRAGRHDVALLAAAEAITSVRTAVALLALAITVATVRSSPPVAALLLPATAGARSRACAASRCGHHCRSVDSVLGVGAHLAALMLIDERRHRGPVDLVS